ncbi:MAG: HAMP domain-containing histidine kinase [Alphaproteobacteria bacterium]|nr:HAMP domain-containing histidine kinase [Alphaproteobacteria bacterium]
MAGAARWLRSGLACRLCRRVTAATFVAIFVIEAVILVPSYFRREGELLTRLEETSLAAARTAMRLTPRKDLAADIAASLGVSAGSTPLLGVTLYYPDGRFVDSFGEVPTLTPPIGPDWNGMAMARTGGSYEVAWTAATLESPFTMVARLDASMVDRELRAFVARIAGLVAVIALFVTAATMLILAYAVLGPVLALRNRLIAAGADPTQPESYLLGERADELGDVNRAFNAMIRRIAANIDAIENQRKQLAKAHDAVLRANQAKSDFLAGMSHELRTPLNAIIGFSELMRSQMFGPLGNPRYIEHAGIIHDSGNHLLELINGILDFSKAEAGRVELHVEETVFADLAEASVRMVGERAAKAGVALELQLPEPPVAIAVDGLRLKQVLLNLLTNAIKFTPSGGRVTLAAGLVPHGFQISVADTGIGIAPEDLERVMEPFGQARDSRVRDQEGTGLGLPLAKHLIELHGGLLTLASEYGRGTTVTATLPAACARPLRP